MNSHINNYKDGQILDVYFLITQNNFVFYESNAEFISELDENVLKDVVRFYITAKSLIDTFNTNNTNINKISEIAIKIAEEPMNESYRGLLAAYTNIASQYAPMIIEINNETLRCQQQVILSINRKSRS
jgi:Mg2+ and Co2+ transporter CorA